MKRSLTIKWPAALLVLLAALSATAVYAQVGGGFDLSWNTVDGGGGTFSAGGPYNLGGTAGQPDAAAQAGGPYDLQSGFWSVIAGGTVIGTSTITPTPLAPTPSYTSSSTQVAPTSTSLAPTATRTATQGGPTATGTSTLVASPTAIASATATNTPTQPAVSSPTSTSTATTGTGPTATPTGTSGTAPTSSPTNIQPSSTPAGTATHIATTTSTATRLATQTHTLPTGTTRATATHTSTAQSISTQVATSTPTTAQTSTPTNTQDSVQTATPTAIGAICHVPFTDMNPEDWSYGYVEYIYCRGLVVGYDTNPPCATGVPCFNPGGTTTRGQLAKIVTLGFGFAINTAGGPHFSDAQPGSTFYQYIETLYNLQVLNGYADGTFGVGDPVTRGQIAKIVTSAAILADPANWTLENPADNTFQDVLPGSTFFRYIETGAAHHLFSGYPCAAPPALPCVSPANRPFFLPDTSTTRAQISKIIFLAITAPPMYGR